MLTPKELLKPPIPGKHGTWAMLYAPMLIAILADREITARAGLLIWSASALFFLHDPLQAAIRMWTMNISDSSRRIYFRFWSGMYAIIALIPAGILLFQYHLFGLFWFGLLAASGFFVHAIFTFFRKERSIPSELIAVMTLTSSAPAMQYVQTGMIHDTGWLLWIVSILYFWSSVFYVKMRVKRQINKDESTLITLACHMYHVFLIVILAGLAVYHLVPTLTLAAFIPIVIRAFQGAQTNNKLNLKRIGFAEVAFTLFFVGCMAVSVL
jgi:hypothetical protein